MKTPVFHEFETTYPNPRPRIDGELFALDSSEEQDVHDLIDAIGLDNLPTVEQAAERAMATLARNDGCVGVQSVIKPENGADAALVMIGVTGRPTLLASFTVR